MILLFYHIPRFFATVFLCFFTKFRFFSMANCHCRLLGLAKTALTQKNAASDRGGVLCFCLAFGKDSAVSR